MIGPIVIITSVPNFGKTGSSPCPNRKLYGYNVGKATKGRKERSRSKELRRRGIEAVGETFSQNYLVDDECVDPAPLPSVISAR